MNAFVKRMLIIIAFNATMRGIYLGILCTKNYFALNYKIGKPVDALEGNWIYEALEYFFISSIVGELLYVAIMTAGNVYRFYQRWIRDDWNF
jgi:hypothetical protein